MRGRSSVVGRAFAATRSNPARSVTHVASSPPSVPAIIGDNAPGSRKAAMKPTNCSTMISGPGVVAKAVMETVANVAAGRSPRSQIVVPPMLVQVPWLGVAENGVRRPGSKLVRITCVAVVLPMLETVMSTESGRPNVTGFGVAAAATVKSTVGTRTGAHAAHVEQLAWIFETIDSWAAHAPSLYLSARMSWNTHLDVDREMDRFYTGFYGAAAEPMKSYWTRLDNAYATTPTHCGSSYGMHKVWTPALLAASRADIDRALKVAANDREREAVQMADAGLRSAELFMKIWNAIAACDFATAAATQKKLEEHCKAMDQKPEPHWAHLRYAFNQYYMTFIGKVVDAGNTLGKIVVKLPDIWEVAGKPMGTMSTCWADEGRTWFQGEMTYRTTFEMPAEKLENLNLWFGGVDNNVDVTLNGHALGEKTGFIKPQSFENIGAHLKFGEKNEIVVRVSAGSLAEIGTGGIMMPVVIYQGKIAAPDNKPKPAYEM